MRNKDFRSLALFVLLVTLTARANPEDYFAIQVLDDQTGRGVPMVELKTTSCATYYTDSDGYIAFNEPGLMNRVVWFEVSSQGYEPRTDMFGQKGVKLTTKPGGMVKIKIKRLNIAERLYRVTGEGIYRDTVLLGRQPPVPQPPLNAEVTGQDGVLNAIYHGKLFWFYGDTLRAAYALGNYHMAGATTDLPDKIDPSAGFVLHYFTGDDGFARAMAPMNADGVVWLNGLVVLPGTSGAERMLAFYQRRQGMGAVLENGFVQYNDAREEFEKLGSLPLDPPIRPQGYPFLVTNNGVKYVYFTAPYPDVRIRADAASYLDLSNYEAFTCFKTGSSNELDRDNAGKLVWAWRKKTPPLAEEAQKTLVEAGRMKPAESPFRLQDATTGKPVRLNSSSCAWNEYRQRWILIASEQWGATMLGEVWYAEAPRPEGPWKKARKIITHANKPNDAHDFYNPVHHDFFDRDGGRLIYLEGSYVNTFSGNRQTTPLYEYNQIMYRLDLSDSRLH